MKRYSITILFKNGDRLEANVMARNQADAVDRVKKTNQFVLFFTRFFVILHPH